MSRRTTGKVKGIAGMSGAVTVVTAAALFCCGTAARGEGTWDLLREDARIAYYVQQGKAATGGAEKSIVVLKRVFKEAPGRREPGSTDCSGNPLPRRENYAMAYSLDTVEIDCRSGLYRFTGIVIHDREGDVMHRYRPNDQFIPVPPASYLDTARGRACR